MGLFREAEHCARSGLDEGPVNGTELVARLCEHHAQGPSNSASLAMRDIFAQLSVQTNTTSKGWTHQGPVSS